MALDVKLTIEKTEFLFQESPPCLLVLTNAGRDAVQVLHPAVSESMPILRVVDSRTGEETLFQKKPEGWVPEEPQELPPGKSIERGFLLLEEVQFPSPGPYQISAIYEYNDGTHRVESAPVKVNILPATPKNLSLVHNGPGGSAAVLFGSWVNLAADPPQLVWSRLEAAPGGGVVNVHSLTKTGLETRPALSAPPNRKVAESHWVAWLEENQLKYLHFDENMGASAVNKFELPKLQLEIVSPLHTDPITDTRVRPGGAALVWMGDEEGSRSGLQVIELTPNKAAAGETVNLPGSRPRWMMSVERSDGLKQVAYVQTAGDRTVLSAVPWPEKGAAPPRKLAEWKGKFVSAGATIDAADAVWGAVLIWSGAGGEQKLELVSWSLDARGTFAEKKRQEIKWDYSIKIDSAVLRVNAKGVPFLLLRDAEGEWSVFDGQLKPVPSPFTPTKLPLDLCFLGGVTPILVGGRVQMGFQLLQLDGSPLPQEAD